MADPYGKGTVAKRITLPTLGGRYQPYNEDKDPRLNQTGRYPAEPGYQPKASEIARQYSKRPPFMNTQNAGMNAIPESKKSTFDPAVGTSYAQNPAYAQQYGGGMPFANTPPQAGAGGASWLSRLGTGLMSPNNPFVGGMGGVIGAGLRMNRGQNPFAGGGAGGGGAPGLSPLEQQFRDRYDKAVGPGAWDNFVKTRGMTPVDFYRMPNNRYWEEGPSTPERALDDAIRDEFNNARNAAQWAQEHGNTPIPQEAWDRWYYANRQGMRVDDVMKDGSEVVY